MIIKLKPLDKVKEEAYMVECVGGGHIFLFYQDWHSDSVIHRCMIENFGKSISVIKKEGRIKYNYVDEKGFAYSEKWIEKPSPLKIPNIDLSI